MAWWWWVLLGIGLLVVEMVTPGGLFALFFGIGAICTALAAAAGLPATVQWLLFTVLSLVLLATLRRTLQERMQRGPGVAVDSLVGQEVVLLQEVPSGGEGKAELRGVPWTARVAEQYVGEFGKLAKTTNTVILPATLSDVGSMISLAMNVLRTARDGQPVRAAAVAPPRGPGSVGAGPPRP